MCILILTQHTHVYYFIFYSLLNNSHTIYSYEYLKFNGQGKDI
jgi:hypothetical protein